MMYEESSQLRIDRKTWTQKTLLLEEIRINFVFIHYAIRIHCSHNTVLHCVTNRMSCWPPECKLLASAHEVVLASKILLNDIFVCFFMWSSFVWLMAKVTVLLNHLKVPHFLAFSLCYHRALLQLGRYFRHPCYVYISTHLISHTWRNWQLLNCEFRRKLWLFVTNIKHLKSRMQRRAVCWMNNLMLFLQIKVDHCPSSPMGSSARAGGVQGGDWTWRIW